MIHRNGLPHQRSGVPVCVCKQCDNILHVNITPSIGVDIDECTPNNGGCSEQLCAATLKVAIHAAVRTASREMDSPVQVCRP